MSRPRATFAAFFLALATLVAPVLLGGCVRDPLPELVRTESVLPREVERGDRLEVHGQSFPQGRTARVRFTGEVRRAGRPPRAASASALGVVKAPERLEIAVDEAFEAALAGEGDDAEHVAFHGTVEVAFPAATRGAPPLVGTLEGVVLDVAPARRNGAADVAREGAGRAFVERLGILRATVDGAGLRLDEVADGSPASRAALDVGDVIVRAGGLGVRTLGDLAPQGGATVPLEVRRVGQETVDAVEVGAQGVLAVRAPEARISSGLLVVLVLGLLAWCMPLPGVLGRLEVAAALELRTLARLGPSRFGAAFCAAAPGGRRAVSLGVLAAALLLVGVLPSPSGLVGVDLDLVALAFLASVLGLASSVARSAGWRGRLAGLARGLVLPVSLGLGAVAIGLAAGTVRTDELARAALHGGPRGALALATLVAVAGAVAAGGRVDPAASPRAALLDRLASLFAAAFLAVLVLGALPDATPGGALARFAPRAAGLVALVLILDAALLAARLCAPTTPRATRRVVLAALSISTATLAVALLGQREVGVVLIGSLGVSAVVALVALAVRLVVSSVRLRVVDVDPFV